MQHENQEAVTMGQSGTLEMRVTPSPAKPRSSFPNDRGFVAGSSTEVQDVRCVAVLLPCSHLYCKVGARWGYRLNVGSCT